MAFHILLAHILAVAALAVEQGTILLVLEECVIGHRYVQHQIALNIETVEMMHVVQEAVVAGDQKPMYLPMSGFKAEPA